MVPALQRRLRAGRRRRRGCRKHDPLYRIRNILRAGQENLTDRQRARLEAAFVADDRHVEVEVAWSCAQQLRACYHQDSYADGRAIAEKILDSFTTCPIPEVARLGRTLKQWRSELLGYFDTSGANNGGTEAIIIWSPVRAVSDVADGAVLVRRRHDIWSLYTTETPANRPVVAAFSSAPSVAPATSRTCV